jgi:hypothetical protein
MTQNFQGAGGVPGAGLGRPGRGRAQGVSAARSRDEQGAWAGAVFVPGKRGVPGRQGAASHGGAEAGVEATDRWGRRAPRERPGSGRTRSGRRLVLLIIVIVVINTIVHVSGSRITGSGDGPAPAWTGIYSFHARE